MSLNSKIYENLISLWGKYITLQDGCYIKTTNLYSSIQSCPKPSNSEKNTKAYDIAKKMILDNIETQKKIKKQKAFIRNIFNGTEQSNNNTLPILLNLLQYRTSNNSLSLP